MKHCTAQAFKQPDDQLSSETKWWRLPFGESAQSLVEVALLLPMMCLVLLGIGEIGRAAYMSMVLGNAATAGVEYGAQDSSAATKISEIQNAALCDANSTQTSHYGSCAPGILTVANIGITHGCQCDTGSGQSCSPMPADGTCATVNCTPSQQVVECIRVTTHADFAPLFGYPGLPSTFQANGRAVMRVRR